MANRTTNSISLAQFNEIYALRRQHDIASHSREVAKYEDLCTLLQQNDGSITRVESPSSWIARGYGHQLGQALVDNTPRAISDFGRRKNLNSSHHVLAEPDRVFR